MALVIADRVRDTTTSTGTGPVTVSGLAPVAHRAFSAVCNVADTFYYLIEHPTAFEWEVGLGTYSSANTITRTTVHASSNSGSTVNFSSGTKNVYLVTSATQVSDFASKTVPVFTAATSLFNHAGSNHQIKINKAATGNTASVLFQNNASGRAEVGLTGDDKLHVKTSPDGVTWTDALVVDPATGWVGIGGETAPEGPLHIRRTTIHPLNDRADESAAAAVAMSRKSRGTHAARTALIQNDVPQSFFGQGYDGTAFVGCANVRWIIDGPVAVNSIPTMAEIWTFTSGVGHTKKFEVTSDGTARPSADNVYSLGDATNRWASIWAANGTIQTSDARDKDVTGRVDGLMAAGAVDVIEPVHFRWKVGGYEVQPHPTETETDEAGNTVPKMVTVPKPGTRLHAGFLAQEVKAAMDAAGVDFGVWGMDDPSDPDSRQWLRPDQIIPVLWAALRETRKDVRALCGEPSRGLETGPPASVEEAKAAAFDRLDGIRMRRRGEVTTGGVASASKLLAYSEKASWAFNLSVLGNTGYPGDEMFFVNQLQSEALARGFPDALSFASHIVSLDRAAAAKRQRVEVAYANAMGAIVAASTIGEVAVAEAAGSAAIEAVA